MRRRSGSGLTRCGVAGPSGSGLDRVTLRGDKKRCLSIHIPRGDAASARYLAREIFEYETYAAQGLEVTKGDTVVDVGANIGLFSIWASDLGARVLAFEPQQDAYQALVKNCGGRDVVARRVAIGRDPGEALITSYRGASGWGTLKPSKRSVMDDVAEHAAARPLPSLVELLLPRWARRQVGRLAAMALLSRESTSVCRVATLSAELAELLGEGDRVKLLKIDVERGELDVLRGIHDFSRIDSVVAEVHDEEGGGVAEFVSVLESNGLRPREPSQSKELLGTSLYTVFATRDN